MRVKRELEPSVTKKSQTEYIVSFWFEQKRYRYSNGKTINVELSPNTFPLKKRRRQAEVLCSYFTMAIKDGWRPRLNKITTIESVASKALKTKHSLNYSTFYLRDLYYTENMWTDFIKRKGVAKQPFQKLTIELVEEFIYEHSYSNRRMLNLKGNISALLKDELESNGIILNFSKIKLPKSPQMLHKPIKNVKALLCDINEFNENLHLCCLMTFTMLLRPHREVRCLAFSDFNSDFTQLSLSGAQVKSKRNRIVPVPKSVREIVIQRFSGERNKNLFTLKEASFNKDYFKTLWTRYKKQSQLLHENQTLYSFRHSGAIMVFEKTGSLQKLQQVMGHSSMTVSLTYLRGLEVKQLEIEDLPSL